MAERPRFAIVAPAAARRPIVAHIPHASRVIPPDVRAGLLVDDADLERAFFEAYRHEMIVLGRFLRDIFERLERHGGIGDGAHRDIEEFAAGGGDVFRLDAHRDQGFFHAGAG